MSEPDSNLASRKLRQVQDVAATLQDLVTARAELVKLESIRASQQIKQLVIVLCTAIVLTIVGLTLLIIVGSYAMESWSGLHHVWWKLIFGSAAIIVALALGWIAWRRFSTQFAPLKHSIAEIQEDIAWLKEYWDDGNRPEE